MANKSIDKHYLLETLKDFYTTILLTFFQKKLTVTTVPADPSNGDVIIYVGVTTSDFTQGHTYKYASLPGEWTDITPAGGGTWGSITGTLSDQTDLQAALDEKATPVELTQPEYDDLTSAQKNDESKVYFISGRGNLWESISWSGFTNPKGSCIWTDGTNVYCSLGYATNENYQYKLNDTTWESMTWSGYNVIYGERVWKNGNNIYYSYNTNQYKLNDTTWEAVTWSGLTSFDGNSVWTDGTNIYYSLDDKQYKLNGTTWETVTWNISISSGSNIWTDGTDTYYSYESNQYKLNGTTWEAVTWSGLTSFNGNSVWTDGIDIFYSYNANQYKLNGTTWESITWSPLQYFYGFDIWTDGTDYYYSKQSYNQTLIQYKLVKNNDRVIYYKNISYPSEKPIKWGNITGTLSNQTDLQNALDEKAEPIELTQIEYNALTYAQRTDESKVYFIVDKTPGWIDFTDIDRRYVWTDGTNIYYSYGSNQYKLNGTVWEPITWNINNIDGSNIWTDGTNIYLYRSNGSYKLNGTTWESVSISGGPSLFMARYVWTDGTNIYYSDNSNQYKLNGTVWESVTWNINNIDGYNIWTDGTNTYYSYGSSQYKLNGATWDVITWTGLTSLNGMDIWTDGTDTYYASYSSFDPSECKHYKLNGTTWELASITVDDKFITFYGRFVWTDGTNIYYSYPAYGGGQHILDGTTWKPFVATTNNTKVCYKNVPYGKDSIILSSLFAANASSVAIDISSLNISSNDYTFKYFSSVEGMGCKNTSYNSYTGIFTINFKGVAPSSGTFYIEAYKVN